MWRLIIIGIVAALVGGFFLRWQYLEKENDRLNTALTSANATVGALDDVVVKNREIEERENDAVDEIESAPSADDGPVAPVLRRAIDRINRMQDNGE